MTVFRLESVRFLFNCIKFYLPCFLEDPAACGQRAPGCSYLGAATGSHTRPPTSHRRQALRASTPWSPTPLCSLLPVPWPCRTFQTLKLGSLGYTARGCADCFVSSPPTCPSPEREVPSLGSSVSSRQLPSQWRHHPINLRSHLQTRRKQAGS